MYTRGDESMMYGPEQKGYVLHIVQPTMYSTLGVYDIRPLIARYSYMLPLLFPLF